MNCTIGRRGPGRVFPEGLRSGFLDRCTQIGFGGERREAQRDGFRIRALPSIALQRGPKITEPLLPPCAGVNPLAHSQHRGHGTQNLPSSSVSFPGERNEEKRKIYMDH